MGSGRQEPFGIPVSDNRFTKHEWSSIAWCRERGCHSTAAEMRGRSSFRHSADHADLPEDAKRPKEGIIIIVAGIVLGLSIESTVTTCSWISSAGQNSLISKHGNGVVQGLLPMDHPQCPDDSDDPI